MDYILQISEILSYHHIFYKGLLLTVELSLLSIIIGLIMGWMLAILRVFGNKILSIICGLYIEFWRSTPLLLQLFFVYFGVTAITGFSFTAFQAGLVAIVLNTAAYNAEIIRGGIQAIPKTQIESAKSLGLSFFQILRTITIPYVQRIVFPSLTNQFILTILGTSVLSVIAVNEIMCEAKELQAITGRSIEIYLLAAIFYIVLIGLFTLLMRFLEKKVFFIRH